MIFRTAMNVLLEALIVGAVALILSLHLYSVIMSQHVKMQQIETQWTTTPTTISEKGYGT